MKKTKIFLTVVLAVLVLPLVIKADEVTYESKNFVDTLAAENITISNSNYSENDKQVTIYLFRGQGCGYTIAFLNFMNSISEEYGDYFKMVSYEVWYNANNADLFQKTSKFLDGSVAGGVPYVIIGKKTFGGYTASWDEEIKQAIMDEYNNKDRYDVFEEMSKEDDGKEKTDAISSSTVILWNLIFSIISTSIIVLFFSYKFGKFEHRLKQVQSFERKQSKIMEDDK